jgi:uncharacterized protein (TIGR03790 family)
MNRCCTLLLTLLGLAVLPLGLQAGGSGLNVVVVVNQNSTNSVQLGNYYCEKRQVPPQNLLRTSWAGGNVAWMKSDFETVILNPLLAMLSNRRLTNQIDYVLLSMDFPYRVNNGGSFLLSGTNSTTSALFYGFKTDYPPLANPGSCSLASGSVNAYAGSEGIFRLTPPVSARSNSFLVTMITASNLAQAKWVIDRAVASDGTLPTQTVYLGKSDDVSRNVRYALFDNVVFNTRLRGNYSVQRTNVNWSNYLGDLSGYENGYQTSIPTTNYVPGALADQLTSFGGDLYDQSDHTTALDYLNAGAAGSYGTIVEPCGYLEKFPNPQLFFYQSRGFTMAECYYQSVTNPYQGLVLGEPLSAPFARPGTGSWSNLAPDVLLSGITNLTFEFQAADAAHPLQQADLFVDGVFAQTLTNIPPGTSNVLSVALNGYPTNYVVPAGAVIQSVVSNLAVRLNQSAYTNATKILAIPHGDRIELQSFDLSRAASQIPISVESSIGLGTVPSTAIAASGDTLLDTVAFGIRGFSITGGSPSVGAWLQLSFTKTNGTVVTVAVTNTASGTTLPDLAQGLVSLVNSSPALQGPDGVTAEDFVPYDLSSGQPYPQFNLRALTPGWNAAQLQAILSTSGGFTVKPSGPQRLDQNVADLRPRAHLYVTAGMTNLLVTFAFNTTTQADGYHELTAVVYEGSHVRTQQRASQTVHIQNSSLSAVFSTLFGASNTVLGATLQFSITANTNNISKIELFSTGGSLTNVLGNSSATFSVAGTNLGPGLHPFYAIVTANGGQQYRTETKWIRLGGAESPFALSLAAPAATLAWPATAGRSYDILSAGNLSGVFQVAATVIASNSPALWTDTNLAPQRFYRVRTSN